ncbi:MAG: SGNH/GDSL hydrolase family protein [Planctomycetota bacterium]
MVSRRMRLASSCALALVVSAASPAESQSVRVLPLGDSITEAYTGYASYRYWLWQDLISAGYSVDFVGSMQGVYAGPPLYTDFDLEHEGHWGWRIDQVLAQLPSWAADADPDISLVHIGHNDLWQGQGISSTIAELDALIDTLRAQNPSIAIVLAQVIPAAPGIGLDEIPAFNVEVAALAALKDSPQSPVVLVDHYTGFDPSSDTWDGVHPDESGEQLMAQRWLAVLMTLLPSPSLVFKRADCNADGGLNIADAIAALSALFESMPLMCIDACDSNDDGDFDLADPIYSLTHVFSLGPPPPAPFSACGVDPTSDAIGCDAFAGCL